jgi:hypothetical protein
VFAAVVYNMHSSHTPAVTNQYTTYTDLECSEGATINDRDMTCNNIIGRFGSAKGMCNSDASALPMPMGKYVVET